MIHLDKEKYRWPFLAVSLIQLRFKLNKAKLYSFSFE